jgi:hypothetical protein
MVISNFFDLAQRPIITWSTALPRIGAETPFMATEKYCLVLIPKLPFYSVSNVSKVRLLGLKGGFT